MDKIEIEVLAALGIRTYLYFETYEYKAVNEEPQNPYMYENRVDLETLEITYTEFTNQQEWKTMQKTGTVYITFLNRYMDDIYGK